MGDSKKTAPSGKNSFNMKEIKELADFVDERGFTDFELENDHIRVRMSKAVNVTAVPSPVAAPVAPAAPAQTVAEATPESPAAEDADDGLIKVTSPIVGTFYRAPAPEKPPFVKEGDTVAADTVVCIVEAMKLMNEIQAETTGEVIKVYVENGEPVEFGQPLFGIKG